MAAMTMTMRAPAGVSPLQRRAGGRAAARPALPLRAAGEFGRVLGVFVWVVWREQQQQQQHIPQQHRAQQSAAVHARTHARAMRTTPHTPQPTHNHHPPGCRHRAPLLRVAASSQQQTEAQQQQQQATTSDASAAARQMLGMKGAALETDKFKIRVQLTKPVTWVPLIWGAFGFFAVVLVPRVCFLACGWCWCSWVMEGGDAVGGAGKHPSKKNTAHTTNLKH